MQSTATALAKLDPAARARTLQWLCQRFDADVTPVAQAAAPPAPVTLSPLRIVPAPVAATDETPDPAIDETLSVEALSDLFDPRQAEPASAPAASTQSVTGLLSEFVAEFQQFAREWDDACTAPVETSRPVRRLSAVS